LDDDGNSGAGAIYILPLDLVQDPTEYDITYNLDGGSNHGSNPATYTIETATITLLDPTKTGYTFNDWYSEAEFTNEITEITLGSTGNVTLYAKFTINEYTVTFNGNTSDGGAVPSNIDQNYDTQVTVPGNTGSLTKTGYTFDGWNTEAGGGGTEYVATDTFNMPANNSTLYSQWTTVTYDITYNLNSGTNHSSNPATYKIDTATITLLDPTKTGYTFGGWYSETEFTNEITEITIGSTGDVTLYAQWTTVTYDITYNLDGGSNNGSNPATYTIITATITLLNPTKTGYTFEDWYSEIGFTNKITRITTGSIGNETLYAKWEIIPATPATTTPPAEEEEEEEIVEEVIPEEITEEEIVIVKQILEDTEEEGDDINQDEGVVIKVGDNSIDTKGKKTIHVYQDSGLELTIPVNSLSESSDDIDNVYAALGESVIKLTLNTVGDEYIGTIVAENMTGDNNIDILTIFKDSTSKKSILSISIDPYGYVYTINKDGNQVRIKDATITLYQVIDGERKLYSTSGQENPQKTDLEGQYSFMVEPGTYVIEVKADGYKDYRSEEIEVEKTIVELNIEIEESFDIFDYWFYMLTILIVLPVLFSLYSKFKHTH